jgi:hypothetical protein
MVEREAPTAIESFFIGPPLLRDDPTANVFLTFALVGFAATLVAGGAAGLGLRWAIAPMASCGFWTLMMSVPAVIMRRARRKRRVDVGDDGVLVHGRERAFVPFAEIVDVDDTAQAIFLTHRTPEGGIDPPKVTALPKTKGSEGLADAIRARMSKRGTADVSPALRDALARGERSVGAWREHLARAFTKERSLNEGYRDVPPVDEETLASIVEDPAQPPEQRVGAALAVALAEEPKLKARVRIAASASIDPDLRAALEEAAEGELAEGRLNRLSATHAR